MKHILSSIALALSLSLLTACYAEKEPTMTATPAAAMVIPHSTHAVKCGCDIESVGHCGNYVDIDGTYYAFNQNEGEGTKLGAMDWCGIEGANAEIEGEIKDGEFVATFIKKIQP